MKHRRVATACSAVLLAFSLSIAATVAALADAIPEGSTISGSLSTDLDSGKAQVGDGFSLAVVRPYPNGDPTYAGAFVRGHVSRVIRAGQGREPELDLAFDSIVLADGSASPLSGHVLTVEAKKKTAVVQQAAGAGIGMLVGNFLFKKVGSSLGGLAGAAGGFFYANNRKTDFVVPRNSVVTLQTDTELTKPQAR